MNPPPFAQKEIEVKLGKNWSCHYSQSFSNWYYYNKKTNVRFWVRKELKIGWTYELQKGQKLYFDINNKNKTISDTLPADKMNDSSVEVNKISEKLEAPLSPKAPKRRLENEDLDSNESKKAKINLLGSSKVSGADQQVAASFYDNLKRAQADRGRSLVSHLRSLNNWIKMNLIRHHVPKTGARILDLACGKGGDMSKMMHRNISSYTGVDIAQQSLNDAVHRLKGSKRWSNHKFQFGQADLGTTSLYDQAVHCWDSKNDWRDRILLEKEDTFDAISIQFALHYFFGEKSRAEFFFQQISRMLKPGGYCIATTVDANVVLQHAMRNFGEFNANGNRMPIQFKDDQGRVLCQIMIDDTTRDRILSNSPHEDWYGLRYTFQLSDAAQGENGEGSAVNAPEYLIPNTVLNQLLADNDLELVMQENFHPFVLSSMREEEALSVAKRMHVPDFQGSISSVEWDIARLYQVMAFRKLR